MKFDSTFKHSPRSSGPDDFYIIILIKLSCFVGDQQNLNEYTNSLELKPRAYL